MNATENDSNDPARFPVSQNHANVLEMMAESLCMGTKNVTDIGFSNLQKSLSSDPVLECIGFLFFNHKTGKGF